MEEIQYCDIVFSMMKEVTLRKISNNNNNKNIRNALNPSMTIHM